MKITYQDVHYGELTNYSSEDVLDFGKFHGETIHDVMEFHPDYIEWLLNKQDGFSLTKKAYEFFNGLHCEEIDCPDHKLPLTETTTLPNKKSNAVTNFQPILGVNIMKKVILVAHDNNYHPGSDAVRGVIATEYSYFTNMKNPKIGDYVVVNCAKGLEVCRVTKVVGLTSFQLGEAHKWIVSKVDLSAYEQNLVSQEKIQEIQNKVAERKLQNEGQVILKQMAQEDPTMMKLLRELSNLDSNLVPVSLLESGRKRKTRKVR